MMMMMMMMMMKTINYGRPEIAGAQHIALWFLLSSSFFYFLA